LHYVTKNGRIHVPTGFLWRPRYALYGISSYNGDTNEDLFHDTHLQLQEGMRNPIAFHAEMMGNIMYLQQVLKQPDAKEFVQAVIKEVNGHVDSNNWMSRSKVMFLRTSK
jgi:hypothetical protein